MISLHPKRLLIATAALLVTGCQMDDIRHYGEKCPGVTEIYNDGVLQCSADHLASCPSEYADALAANVCPTVYYKCSTNNGTKICSSGCPGTEKMKVCKGKCYLAERLTITHDDAGNEVCNFACPEECPDDCNEYGVCNCPADCKRGCDAEGKCNPCEENESIYADDENAICQNLICHAGIFVPDSDFNSENLSCNESLTGLGTCKNGSTDCIDTAGSESLHYCEKGRWIDLNRSCNAENLCTIQGNSFCFGSPVGRICNQSGNAFEDCPNAASCNASKTGCGVCQNGQTRCAGNLIETCVDGGFLSKACDTGSHCEIQNDKALCVPSVCEPGQRKCSNNVIYKCENYKWVIKTACICTEVNGEVKCSDGTEDVCESGEIQCSNNTEQTCVNGEWYTGQACPNGCNPQTGKCNTSGCANNARKCDNSLSMFCSNGNWAVEQACTYGCNEQTGKCNTSECAPNERTCNNGMSMFCSNGNWAVEQACTYGCNPIQGTCYPYCKPGSTKCDALNAVTCDAYGTWGQVMSCPMGCDQNTGTCISTTCNDGDYRCDGQTARNCVDHAWVDSDCTDLNTCITTGYPTKAACMGTCVLTTKTCVDRKIYICTNTAEAPDDPGYNYDNASFWIGTNSTCECSPGEKKCNGDISNICNENGYWNPVTCPKGCNQNTGECKTKDCEGGEMICLNGTFANCMEGGVWGMLPACKQNPGTCDNLNKYVCPTTCDKNDQFCYTTVQDNTQYRFVCNDNKTWILYDICEGKCDKCSH
ncbi:MAG: hypothetical protein IKY83_10535 [Proteobacteria bacterium]|nr:hypothetical protein [Pseudomonadota bacterium]